MPLRHWQMTLLTDRLFKINPTAPEEDRTLTRNAVDEKKKKKEEKKKSNPIKDFLELGWGGRGGGGGVGKGA